MNSKTKNRKSQSKSSEKIKIEFTDQKLTNYAGLVAMEPFMNDWLGMRSMLNEDTLKLNRNPNFEYSSYDYISMVLCGILTGGDRMNKVSFMSRDKVLSHAFGWKGTPHASSLARYFKSFESESIEALKALIEKMRRKVWSRIRCRDVTIDIDSTVNTVYGKQEGACKGYNPDHRGERSYHPLLAFVDQTQEVLNERLRPGNCYTGKGADEFIEDCLSNLPAHIRGVTIRGDSGFFDDDLLEKIESYQSKSCTYLIKVKMRNLDRVLADQEWEQSIDPDIMTCDFEYRCGNWQRARRFIGVKVKTDKTDRDATLFSRSEYPEYEYFCFVTNLMTGPLWCYEFYRKRGNCENWIEQVKNHYYAGEIHTQRFQANQILFSLSCLAYNIKQWMTYFTDRRACKEEGKTFRYWFIHTAGRLIHTGRQWYLKMQESYPERERWEWILFRLSRLQP